jgi:hypothetical protein
MRKKAKKSTYRHVVIKNKKYFFYKITWVDIVGDSGHADSQEFSGMKPMVMVTQGYVFYKDNKMVLTFASYEENDGLFSDRNVFPKGCIIKMEKLLI